MHRIGFHFYAESCGEGRQIGVWTKRFKPEQPDLQRKKLVIVPGFGDSPLSWWSLLAPFERSLKAIYSEWAILDFPGYAGFLSKEKGFDSISHLLDSSDQLLRKIGPTTLFGHSLGGWISIHHAVHSLDAGQDLKKLVLMNPSGVLMREDDEVLWRQIFDDALMYGFEGYKQHYVHKAPLWLPLIAPVLNEFFERKENRDFIASVAKEHFLNEKISKIGSHVNLIWSEFDRLNPTHWLEDWKGLLPKAEVTIMRNVGHSPQLERPFQTLATLGPILAEKPQWMKNNPLKKWLWGVSEFSKA